MDLRIVKTKKNIYEALIKLLETNSFEMIKVSEICEQAMINRSTFYAHFEDKYCLLDSLIKDLRTKLKETLLTNENITNSKKYYLKMLELLLNHVEKEKEIYMSVISHNRNSIAMDMIYDTLKEDIERRMKNTPKTRTSIPVSFLSDFYLGAIFNIGMEWLRSNKSYSKKDILNYLDQLIID